MTQETILAIYPDGDDDLVHQAVLYARPLYRGEIEQIRDSLQGQGARTTEIQREVPDNRAPHCRSGRRIEIIGSEEQVRQGEAAVRSRIGDRLRAGAPVESHPTAVDPPAHPSPEDHMARHYRAVLIDIIRHYTQDDDGECDS